jgi:hypothetical protein
VNEFMLPTVFFRAIRINEKEAVANEKKRVIESNSGRIKRGLSEEIGDQSAA